jgi:uncharacterized membrane protein HdeD (DUF308 family)
MSEDTVEIQKGLKKGGLWLIVLGILQVIIGFFAIDAPMMAGIAVSVAVGVILLFHGFFELIGAFQAPSWGWGLFRFLSGLLAGLIGLVMLFKPVLGLGSLTLFIAGYFLIDGIDRIMQGWKMQGVPGRGWIIFGGVTSVVLAGLILAQWPLSSAWAVGVLVGIHLIFAGWAKIFVGISARSAGKEIEAAP